MTKNQISLFLKQLRKTSGLTANDVVNNLKFYDIDISAKTLYGYESGLSMPNADTFVSLCRIYKCDNPLDVFGAPTVTSSEIDHIEKYRALDPHGKEMVDFTLLKEWERSTAEKKNTDVVSIAPTEDTSHYVNAAHPIDGAAEEDKQFDEDIMDDDNF